MVVNVYIHDDDDDDEFDGRIEKGQWKSGLSIKQNNESTNKQMTREQQY